MYFTGKQNLPFVQPLKETKIQPRPTVSEIFDNVSIKEASPDYFEKTVNGISNLIKISIQEGDSAELLNTLEASSGLEYLADGSDGEGDLVISDYERSDPEDDKPGKRKGLTAFKGIDDISIVYAPNAYAVTGLVGSLISHCENLRYRFAIFDAVQGSSDVSDLDPRSDRFSLQTLQPSITPGSRLSTRKPECCSLCLPEGMLQAFTPAVILKGGCTRPLQTRS